MAPRVVLDTNVLVAALLTPGRTPERALEALWARGATVLLDARIEAEYRAVLARAKFAAVPAERREALLASVLARGSYVPAERLARCADALLDDDDRAFVEVARAGEATFLVTGNVKHFPPALGLPVCTPAALLAALGDDAPGAGAAQAPASSERTKAS